MSQKLPITVLMLTLNEEYHLPGILDNIQNWAEDVFIVDSLSTDRTVDIALDRGVKIVQRRFTSFADQWNFALSLPIKTPWVMKMDPDERLSDELRQSITEGIHNEDATGFSVDCRLWFMGKPLHSKLRVTRVWRHNKGHFPEMVVNEHIKIDGQVLHLPGFLEHLDSCNLHRWMAKQNLYTSMLAITTYQQNPLEVTPNLFGSRRQRVVFFKKYFWKIPFRYQLMFLQLYFGRGLWRDGKVGLDWVNARIMMRRLVEMKMREFETFQQVPEIPKAPAGEFDPRVVNSELQAMVYPDYDVH
ncbi:MAG: glycosyltransferase family 2 protein [Planctomycetia bacterium]|jgi:glycosyltransferase involved in cell wall biosynthesis